MIYQVYWLSQAVNLKNFFILQNLNSTTIKQLSPFLCSIGSPAATLLLFCFFEFDYSRSLM